MFKIGDYITPIDDTGQFEIVSMNNGLIYAKDAAGFEHVFSKAEVIPVVSDWVNLNINEDSFRKGKPIIKKRSVKSKRKKEKHVVDLHAGVILESLAGLTNHQILIKQLEEAKDALIEARKNKMNYVVLIHGKGKGRLKEELHLFLNSVERIEYYDAEFRLYSGGATEVKLY